MHATSVRRRLVGIATAVATTAAVFATAAPAHAAAPSITAPASATAGAPAEFSGSDWPAYVSVNLYFVRSTTQTYFCTVHADSDGTIAGQTCAAPLSLVTAAYTVHADDAHGHTADAAGATTLQPSAIPTSTFSGSSGFHVAAGSTLALSGHALAASSALTVKIGTAGVATTPANPVTDSSGSFNNVVVTVPANAAAGQVSVTITDAAANKAVTAVQVYKASITAKASAAAGSPLTLSGKGWPGVDTVNIYVHSTSNGFMCSLRTDSDGTIAPTSCSVPNNYPTGDYQLLATDTAVTVSRDFSIDAGLTAASTFNSQAAPAVAAGGTLTLTGHGFAASSALVAKIGSATLSTTPASPATDTSGSFGSVVATIPANQKAGKVTISVKDAAGNTASVRLVVFKTKVTGPTSAPSGSPQLVGGSGWPPLDAINAYVRTSNSTAFICSLHSDLDGDVATTSCTIPTFCLPGRTTCCSPTGS